MDLHKNIYRLNIDIQIKNGQSFYFRNTKPLQAMRIFKCYVNGYSPDPMSPLDGGPSDGCNEEGDKKEQRAGNFNSYDECQRIFCEKDCNENVIDCDNTELRHDFLPTVFNCTLIYGCLMNYSHFSEDRESVGWWTNHIWNGLDEKGKDIHRSIDPDVKSKRCSNLQDWWDNHMQDCAQHY